VPLNYRVTADAGLNPLRLVFEEVFGAIGLGNAIAPAAEVEITAPDGRSWVFASPPVARTARASFPGRSGQHPSDAGTMPRRVIAYFWKDEERTQPFTFPQIRMIRRTRSARRSGHRAPDRPKRHVTAARTPAAPGSTPR
jgi:hypothetical protein